jgi:hypothetical protein
MFGHSKRVQLLGAEVTLVGFDLRNDDVVAVCQQRNRKARVTLDSVEFPDASPVERLWLGAWSSSRRTADNRINAGWQHAFASRLQTTQRASPPSVTWDATASFGLPQNGQGRRSPGSMRRG